MVRFASLQLASHFHDTFPSSKVGYWFIGLIQTNNHPIVLPTGIYMGHICITSRLIQDRHLLSASCNLKNRHVTVTVTQLCHAHIDTNKCIFVSTHFFSPINVFSCTNSGRATWRLKMIFYRTYKSDHVNK